VTQALLVQLVQAVVSLVLKQQVQQLLAQVVELVQTRQQVLPVQVLREQKQLHLQCRLIQDEHRQEQLYQLQHQLQEEFQQLVKEFQYQPCQLKLLEVLHQLQLNLQHFLANV
jgi:hypothetical protein